MTRQEAADRLLAFFKAHCPRQYLFGTPEEYCDPERTKYFHQTSVVYVRWSIAFGVDCTLTFSLPESPKISWGGMGHSPAEALVCTSLYQQVAMFAAALDLVRRDVMEAAEVAEAKAKACGNAKRR